jgi:hypothetical protein
VTPPNPDRRQPGAGDRRKADLAALYRALEAAYKCVEVSRRSVGEAGQALESARSDLEQCRRAILQHWPEVPASSSEDPPA